MKRIVVKLTGVTFKNQDGSSRQKVLGRIFDDLWDEDREDEIQIELRREPDNPYDSTAVGVWAVKPEGSAGKIGFVPGKDSARFDRALREGRVTGVEFEDMGASGRNAKIWANIAITLSEDEVAAEYLIEDEDGRVYEFG